MKGGMLLLVIFATSTLISFCGVWAFRHWAARDVFLDYPNLRSSHSTPTPRGGGIVFVLVSLVGLNLLQYLQHRSFLPAFTVGALAVVTVSLLDDIYGVHQLIRLFVHGVAAVVVILGLGAFTSVELPVVSAFELGRFGPVATFLWIVWLINAYNFMDGIDGIAALQAVISGVGLALIGHILEVPVLAEGGVLVSGSSLGFLFNNWQPAKVFMGDVGSAFLGYTFAVLPLLLIGREGVSDGSVPLLSLTLVVLFLLDSAFTLTGRILRRERFWEAHREHIYQRLVNAGIAHARVSTIYGIGATGALSGLVIGLTYREALIEILSLTLLLSGIFLIAVWTLRLRLRGNCLECIPTVAEVKGD